MKHTRQIEDERQNAENNGQNEIDNVIVHRHTLNLCKHSQ